MPTLKHHVSVVIPTFNGEELLKKNLPAVLACVRDGDEVIIADDAGTDGSLTWAQKTWHLEPAPADKIAGTELYFATVHLGRKSVVMWYLRHLKNVRFGANANTGFHLAHHPFVLLLNNDVSPAPDVIDALLPYFDDELMFGVGCLEREPDDKGGEQWGGKNRLWFQRGLFMHSRAVNFTSGETAWVSGGSGMFDRAKWLELGGFDKRYYPAYWEDIDISRRAQKRGWKTWFATEAVVVHQHETTHQAVFGESAMTLWSWRHTRTFAWVHSTWWQKLQFLMWLPYHAWKFRKVGW